MDLDKKEEKSMEETPIKQIVKIHTERIDIHRKLLDILEEEIMKDKDRIIKLEARIKSLESKEEPVIKNDMMVQ